MKLYSMTATFGKLERASITLAPGLNLIYAPNEGGKSTWAAFFRAMLYGIDTRERSKKGFLPEKVRFQPWSGLPMEGEVNLEWQGRDITLRRSSKGGVPFGVFQAVYTKTGEPVAELTGENCGQLLTGVSRGVFDRSAFVGSGGTLAITPSPELEQRIAALVSSGEEDVSYSQTQRRLREWSNHRRANRSAGLIPQLEGDLAAVEQTLGQLSQLTGDIAQMEGERAALLRQRAALEQEEKAHRLLAQHEQTQRYVQASQDLSSAQAKLSALEGELRKYGTLPPQEQLKQAQGELHYLKVLDDELRDGEQTLQKQQLTAAQAQAAAEDERFSGLSGDEAVAQAEEVAAAAAHAASAQKRLKKRRWYSWSLAGLLAAAALLSALVPDVPVPIPLPLALAAVLGGLGGFFAQREGALRRKLSAALARHQTDSGEALLSLAQDYRQRMRLAQEAGQRAETTAAALAQRRGQREEIHAALLRFVRSFAPEVTDLFGCSAALSRGLNLGHELNLARNLVAERQRRRDDLSLPQGQMMTPVSNLPATPAQSLQQTRQALAGTAVVLEALTEALGRARGQQQAVGDPAALSAQKEAVRAQLARRTLELEALRIAMSTLEEAHGQLRERFSPQLNRLAGEYLSRLTGGRYPALTLNRELEGALTERGEVIPREALSVSRGTADQLYFSVRLAISQLCLPQNPPILLDDALAAFDEERLQLALELLQERAQHQQILLFTCHHREGEALRLSHKMGFHPAPSCISLEKGI